MVSKIKKGKTIMSEKIVELIAIRKAEFAEIEIKVNELNIKLQQLNNELLKLRVKGTSIDKSIQDLESCL